MTGLGAISRVLREYAPEYLLTLSEQALEKFELYARMLLEYNEKINLTSITQAEDIAIKHFLDSLLVLNAISLPAGATLIDVGTGAGFPGIPLKIVRPDIKLTLLDSLKKRTDFLAQISKALFQENEILHARAEEYGRKEGYRERYDFSTARAVASLPALCEYCLPFVKPGGFFVALKGPEIEKETGGIKRALSMLSGEIEKIDYFDLPPDQKRSLVIIKKISQIPAKYPRAAVKITKTPL